MDRKVKNKSGKMEGWKNENKNISNPKFYKFLF